MRWNFHQETIICQTERIRTIDNIFLNIDNVLHDVDYLCNHFYKKETNGELNDLNGGSKTIAAMYSRVWFLLQNNEDLNQESDMMSSL